MREEAEPGVMPTYIFLVLGSGTVAMPVPDTEAMEADVNSMVTKNLQVSLGPVVLSTILDISTGPSIPLSPGSLISNASSRRSCLLCLLSLSLQ